MEDFEIPDPPLVAHPARADVRRRWIGRYVRFCQKMFLDPEPGQPFREEVLQRQQDCRMKGVGKVLDVGQAGLFLVRWENGVEYQECKRVLDFYKDEATAASYGPRLFPLEYGGGDLRG
jgi:hypothetical protein